MRRIYLGLFLVLSVLCFQCQKEIKYSGVDPITPTPSGNQKTTVQGNILDENGQPLSGVTVRAGNQTATTDSRGYFRVRNALLDKNAALVIAEKAGYFKGYRTFLSTTGVNQVMIQLLKKTAAGDVDAATGGVATLTNGAKVALPANGIVMASGGAPYTGTVKVYATYIDPTAGNISRIVPGSFMADDQNNNRVVLSSYGMLAVELETPGGVKLQIRSGSEATLTTPIPAARQSSAPATISLWYVDEQTGIWKEQGTATKSGSNYVGNVKHFSFWNCDVSSTAVNLGMTLKNADGMPLVHATVRLTRITATYPYATYGYTDSLGQVNGLVPSGEQLLMEVLDPCANAVYSQNVGPFTQASNLGTVTITIPAGQYLTITGKLANCANTAVTHGYAIISIDNIVRYASVDANGNYSLSILNCLNSSPACTIVGVDEGNGQQSPGVSVPVTMPTTNAGVISACGTSTNEYINYTIDNTSYSITSATVIGDSLRIRPDSVMNANNTILNVIGARSPDYIYFWFQKPPAGTGVDSVRGLSLPNLGYLTITQPIVVNITSYPAAVGGFIEGSFSGPFTASTVPHTINGSFRLRRQW